MHQNAYLKSYYLKRFFNQDFWKKLLTGKISTGNTLAELQNLHHQSKQSAEKNSFVEHMKQGLHNFSGKSSILLSEHDLTADEFILLVNHNKNWQQVMANSKITQQKIMQANHTFSTIASKDELVEKTLQAFLAE